MIDDNNFFPSDPKKIKASIRRYERALKIPNHDDGSGKRFLIGPLYLLMADIPGALGFYNWYEERFPDDTPEAFNHLCWVLTLLRSEKTILAKLKLRELIFDNLYIIPLLLGENPKQYPFRHRSNCSELSWIMDGPRGEIFSLLAESEISWFKSEWRNPLMISDIGNYVKLYNILDQTDSTEERGKILQQIKMVVTGTM
jgi:hypothetical protein